MRIRGSGSGSKSKWYGSETLENRVVLKDCLTLQEKMAAAWFTTVPLKALSDQVWSRYQYFCFFKLFNLICGFFAKVTWAFLVYKKQWRNSHKLTLSESDDKSSKFLIRLRSPGYRCKSDMAIFAWRFIWNYACMSL